jgi:hypothetical protein
MQEKATQIHRIRNIDTSSIENQLEGIFRAHVNMSQELVSLRECLNSIMSKILVPEVIEDVKQDERST